MIIYINHHCRYHQCETPYAYLFRNYIDALLVLTPGHWRIQLGGGGGV